MKPSYKVGDKVIVDFLGTKLESEITEVKYHPLYPEKGIYTAYAYATGRYIPYVGENGSETYANIVTDNKKFKSKKVAEEISEEIPVVSKKITTSKEENVTGSFEDFFEYKP